MTDDGRGYELLAHEIIAQACRDYRQRLIELEKEKQDPRDEKKIKGIEASIKAIENFFNSAWFVQLSGGEMSPDYLIKRLRKETYGGKWR